MINPLDPAKEKIEVGKKEEPTPEQTTLNNIQLVEEAEIHAIAHSLGIDKMTDMKKYQDQIHRVYDWAKSKGANNITDIIAEIKGLTNRIGDKNLFNVSVYAGLELERARIDSQIKKFEGGAHA